MIISTNEPTGYAISGYLTLDIVYTNYYNNIKTQRNALTEPSFSLHQALRTFFAALDQ
jgi:hypothetical protein